MFRPFLHGLADILFPRNCILCRQYTGPDSPQICARCHASIEFNTPPFCLRCSRHLPVYTMEGLCTTCLRHFPGFDCAWGAVNYNEPVQALLHQFKYGQKTAVRKVFAGFLDSFLDSYRISLDSFDCAVPVPLHPARYRERGFNQSQLLAQYVHAKTGLPVVEALVRRRPTKIQAFLGRKERWTNLEGAFRIRQSFNISNKSILLIDDLLTTGATASAAAVTLKDAGARKVGLLVVALAP